MFRISRVICSLAVLTLFGFGCLRIGPRIVRVPSAPVQEQASSTRSIPLDSRPVAYLELAEGAATLTRGESRVPAQDRLELLIGDKLTVNRGPVTLIYPDMGASRLESGTEIVVLADDSAQEGSFTEIRLLAGEVWTRFEQLLAPQDEFSVVANGVVATVRGTGFGVSLENGQTDIEVAEHQVEVTSEKINGQWTLSASVPVGNLVTVAAGEGLRISAQDIEAAKAQGELRTRVRKLTERERLRQGFIFGSKKIPLERLRRPDAPIRLLDLKATVSPELKERFQLLKERAQWTPVLTPGFVLPDRQVSPEEQAPLDVFPLLKGPTSTL